MAHRNFNSGFFGTPTPTYRFGQSGDPSTLAAGGVAYAGGGGYGYNRPDYPAATPLGAPFLPRPYIPTTEETHQDVMNQWNQSNEAMRQSRAFANAQRNGVVQAPVAPTVIMGGGARSGGATVVPGNANIVTPNFGTAAHGQGVKAYNPADRAGIRQKYLGHVVTGSDGSIVGYSNYPGIAPGEALKAAGEQADRDMAGPPQQPNETSSSIPFGSLGPPAPNFSTAPGMVPAAPPATATPAQPFSNAATPHMGEPGQFSHPIINPITGVMEGHAAQAPAFQQPTYTQHPGLRVPVSMLGPDSSGGSAGAPLYPMTQQSQPGAYVQSPSTWTPNYSQQAYDPSRIMSQPQHPANWMLSQPPAQQQPPRDMISRQSWDASAPASTPAAAMIAQQAATPAISKNSQVASAAMRGKNKPGVPTAQASAPTRQLDTATAQQLLQQAGGDKDKARALARQQGFTF